MTGASDRRPRRHPGCASGAQLWLLRHTDVHPEWQGKAYGDLDVPLAPDGEAHVRAVAGAFREVGPAAILSSPLGRAKRLAEELARTSGASLRLDDGLREIHRGTWQGRAVAELLETDADDVRAFYADPWGFRAHDGENDAMLSARVWPVLERALAEQAGRTLVVVAHYNVIRVVVRDALDVPPERSFGLRVDTGRGTLLLDTEEGWLLRRSNVASPAPVAPPPEEQA